MHGKVKRLAEVTAIPPEDPRLPTSRTSRLPWAALALAAIVLLPFLNKAYTIDDPVFLREAQALLTDPLHPSAFRMVWASARDLRASEFLPGGPLAAYVLVPLALAQWQEWAGHLLMFIYFATAIAATAALARRFGLSPWAQQAAAVLTASAPVALGMAGTVMPDIPAMMFVALGMERFIAWTQSHRWRAGILAALFLALAVLARINLLVLLAIAAYYALRRSWVLRQDWRNVLPVVLAGGLVLLGLIVTRDPDAAGGTAVSAVGHQLGFDFSRRHVVALLIAYLTTTPLLAALFTRRRLEPSAFLWVWLLVPVPVIAYVQIAPKYLLPALPAAAILAAHGLDRMASRTRILALLAGVGTTLGLLILMADARMAGTARTAAAQLIRPRAEAGERVWYAGHWGFHWYAEAAGAMPLTVDPPFPSRGDIVVGSTVDRPVGLLAVLPRTLIETWGSLEPAGQVMSRHAGFYSDLWGLLPWWWERPEGSGFHVWRVTQ
jgi:4-amino-4-deoxy-L-arabinose transferase-like glycosyltransferase